MLTGLISPARSTEEEIADKLRGAVGDAVADKYRRLTSSLPRQLRAIANSVAEDRAHYRAEAAKADRDLARLETDAASRTMAQHLAPQKERIAKHRDRALAEIKELDLEYAKAKADADAAGQLGSAISEKVAPIPPDRIRLVAGPLQPPRGRDIADLLARQEGVRREIERTRTLPRRREDVIAAIHAAIDSGATPPAIDARRRDDPAGIAQALMIGTAGQGRMVGDAGAGLWLWLLGDMLKERLAELVPNDPEALSDAAREKRIGKLRAELLDLERQEEAAHEAAERQGRTVVRRADADFRAVLSIEVREARHG